MKQIFKFVSPFQAKSADDGALRIRGLASTNDIDRAGDVITHDAWTRNRGLDNFKANPIILMNHDANEPIGRAESLEVTDNGLELFARISEAAEKWYKLIKDGVLGAFSVSFLIKDADYLEETGGLRIKDAELLEVSVVSIPCNQAATFSLAKAFEGSKEEYEAFKKTFTKNSVDLAGQANNEDNSSTGTTPAGTEKSVQKEIKMDEATRLEMEAIAQKAAEDAAAKQALKQAEEKAQASAKAKAEAEAEAKLKATVVETMGSGTEKLLADMEARMTAKDADLAEVMKQFKTEMEAKSQEIADMRNSKRVFSNREEPGNISKYGQELMYAHMLGVITQKGWNTDYASRLAQKAGIDYTTNAGDLDQEIRDQIEKELTRELKVAKLFRRIPVNGAATVLPIQPDVGLAEWAINATSGNLENNPQGTADTYQPKQVILNAYRLVSSTFMDNDVDEQVLVNLMPMLIDGVARAHSRSVERMCLTGDAKSSSNISGLNGYAATYTKQIDLDATSVATGDSALMTADLLLGARQSMGKYGVNPTELVYIVSQNSYFDLLSDSKFQTLDEVGSDHAVRLTGSLGSVYGTPVIVSDEFPAETAGAACAFVVWTRNYVIPTLRDIKVEQAYEVMNQRRVIVASQSLGFEEILPGNGSGIEPSVKITFTA